MAEFTQTTYPVDPEAGKDPLKAETVEQVNSLIDTKIEQQYPILREGYFAGGLSSPITITNTDITSLYSYEEIEIPEDGFIEYEGLLVVKGNTEVVLAHIRPYLGQVGSTPSSFGSQETRWWTYTSLPVGSYATLPFNATMPVKKTNGTSVQKLKKGLGLYASSSAGFDLVRMREKLTFYPSKTDNFVLKEIAKTTTSI